ELDSAHVPGVLLPVVLDRGLRELELAGDVDDGEADRRRWQRGNGHTRRRARRGRRGGATCGRPSRTAGHGDHGRARADEESSAIDPELADRRHEVALSVVHAAPPTDVESARARPPAMPWVGEARRLTDLTSWCNISCAFTGQGAVERMTERIDRREFLRRVGLGAGATILAGCVPQTG